MMRQPRGPQTVQGLSVAKPAAVHHIENSQGDVLPGGIVRDGSAQEQKFIILMGGDDQHVHFFRNGFPPLNRVP